MEATGKVLFVTGGASGLGEATVEWFAQRGNKVGIMDLSEENGAKLVEKLGADNVIFCKGDVTSEEDMQAAIDATVEKFGRLDVCVCCAGIGSGTKIYGKRGVHPLGSFNKVIQIDLIGSFNAMRLAVEKMVKNEPNADGERGVVIFTSSIAAWEGQIGQVAYSAAKGGVNGMVLPAARELADTGIRVVGIAPGIVATPQLLALPEKVFESLNKSVPFPNRMARPAEFAKMVEFMIEDAMMNGTVVRMDGALRMQAR